MGLAVLEDQQQAALGALPPEVLAYYDAGAGGEVTRAESEGVWGRFRLRPRVLRDVGRVDLATTVAGIPLPHPVGIAPMAFHALAHPDGEVATVTGAGRSGALTVLSTRASRTIEDVAAAATAAAGPWWFQVYVMKDRRLTEQLVARAAAAGAGALVLTGDTPYVGLKRRVDGVRLSVPDDHFLVNLAAHMTPGGGTRADAEQDPTIDLATIGWLREVSGLPVLVKGVLRGDDAVACLEAGAAGVVVSNHGGRQLDRSLPSALALPEVAAAVAGRGAVLVDGGLRTGLDVLVALGLGADAVLLGRPVLWALASGGAEGVADCVAAVAADLAHVMALAGATGPADLPTGLVVPAHGL